MIGRQYTPERVFAECVIADDLISDDTVLPEIHDMVRDGLLEATRKAIESRWAAGDVWKVEHGDVEVYLQQPSSDDFIRGALPAFRARMVTRVWVPYVLRNGGKPF